MNTLMRGVRGVNEEAENNTKKSVPVTETL